MDVKRSGWIDEMRRRGIDGTDFPSGRTREEPELTCLPARRYGRKSRPEAERGPEVKAQ